MYIDRTTGAYRHLRPRFIVIRLWLVLNTCNRFNVDVQSVKDKKLSLKRLSEISKLEHIINPITMARACKSFNPTDLAAVTKIEDIPWNKATTGEVKLCR
jgi:hypothetical protein